MGKIQKYILLWSYWWCPYCTWLTPFKVDFYSVSSLKPEALKSLYRSPGYKKNRLVLCKNYVLQW
jgi:hypothetical protein